MPATFPCPACGAPVEPAPNQETMGCPFCGSALSIPPDLRWKQAAAAPPPQAARAASKPFDPFSAAANTRLDEKARERVKLESGMLTSGLRQAQPLARKAALAYNYWILGRQFLPGCVIALIVSCLVGCAGMAALVFVLRQNGLF